jgi:hypothetical protein
MKVMFAVWLYLVSVMSLVAQRVRQGVKQYGSRIGAVVALVVPGFAFAQTTSSYLPSTVGTFYTQLGTDFGTLTTNAWPIVLLVAGTLFAIAVFKKITAKAK